MLYEMVALPNRILDPYVTSTKVMWFINPEHPHGLEVFPHIYGHDVVVGSDLALCPEDVVDYKYKTVEMYGDMIIERLLISPEPVLIHSKWWTSNDKVMVLQSKYFCKDVVYIIRNVAALTNINDSEVIYKANDSYDVFDNMYVDSIAKILAQDRNKRHIADLLQYIIPDKDMELCNLVGGNCYKFLIDTNNYEELNNVNDSLCGGVGILPSMSIMPYSEPNTSLKTLANMVKYPDIESGAYKNYSNGLDDVSVLLDTDKIITDINYSWHLLELLYKLNGSKYTDIKIEYDFTCDNTPRSYCTSVYNRQRKIHRDVCLERLFKLWIIQDKIKSNVVPITMATLYKTWNEEVFIVLNCQGDTITYYFDLVAIIAGAITL